MEMQNRFRVISFAHLAGAGKYALAGLRRAWLEEQAFRHEVIVLAALPFALYIRDAAPGLWALALGGWLVLMAVELLNSAVENAFDLITRERDERVKAGKDMASAAILLTLAANVGIWLFVFLG
jgi:diacylglycerol kinase (ATP)